MRIQHYFWLQDYFSISQKSTLAIISLTFAESIKAYITFSYIKGRAETLPLYFQESNNLNNQTMTISASSPYGDAAAVVPAVCIKTVGILETNACD